MTTMLSAAKVATTRVAADRLGITVQAVRKRCRVGTLPAVLIGDLWLIDTAALDEAVVVRDL
jgi:excisionase family DNA binding protein